MHQKSGLGRIFGALTHHPTWGFGTSGLKSFDDLTFSIAVGFKCGLIWDTTANVLAEKGGCADRLEAMLAALEDFPFKQ